MATLAGKAIVPFEGDTSSLLGTIASTVSSAGGMFSKMVPVAVIASIAAVAAGVVDLASKYASATDLMAANSGLTIKQANLIGSAFLSTAGQTTFSAEEMMSAYAPVSGQLEALNGKALSAAQATSFMAAAMALAEATGQSLSATTASLAGVMQTYGIPVRDAAAASDLLYNVSRSLDMPISSVASAVDKLRTKLGPLAPSLSDVGTLLLDLSEHGVSGARGLLAVNTGMTTLLGGSKATDAELATLGLNIYDASGKFVGMASVISQLEPKLATMTEAQRLAAEKALFGASASKTLDDTIMAGLPGWDSAAAAADKTGTAQAGAKTATDNLAGSFDRIKAAATDFAIKAGEVLLPIVADIAENILPVITSIATWVSSLTGLWAAVGTVFGGIKTAVADVVSWITDHWNQISSITTTVFGVIGRVISIAWTIITTTIHDALQVIVPIVQVAWNVISTVIGTAITVIIAIVKTIVSIVQFLVGVWNTVTTDVKNFIGGVVGFFTALPGEIMKVFTGALTWLVNFGKDIITGLWNGIVAIWTTVTSWLGTVFKVVTGFFSTAITWLYDVGRDIITGLWNGIVVVWKTVTTWGGDAFGAVTGFFKNALTWLYNIGRNVVTGLWNGISAVWTTVTTWGGNVFSAVTGFFKNAATWLYNIGKSIIQGLWNGLTAVWNHLTGWIGGIGNWISQHKGPISADAVLLFPHGQAIMQGLHDGLKSGVAPILDTLTNLSSQIASSISGSGTLSLTASVAASQLATAAAGGSAGPTQIGVGGADPQVVLNRSQSAGFSGGSSGGAAGDTYHMHNYITGITDEALLRKMNDAVGRFHGQALQLARAKGRR